MYASLDSLYVRRRPLKALARMTTMTCFEGRAVMQRGRWINPLVLAHLSLLKHLPQLKPVRQPVFIMGTGRSGTTILGRVLSFHRQVGYLNEPKGLWYSVFPEEDVIGSYTLGDASYRLGPEDVTEVRARSIHRIYGAYLRAVFATRIVDKSDWTFRVSFLRALFPDARFLFLIRNGWDTCRSVEKASGAWGYRRGRRSYDWWGVDGRKWRHLVDDVVAALPELAANLELIRGLTAQIDRAAVEWIVVMREALRLEQERSDCVKLVRFEELCRRPRETLEGVRDFCGLAEDRGFIDYAATVIRPLPKREPFAMHEAVQPMFAEMMTRLEYR